MDSKGRIKRLLVHPLFVSLVVSLVIFALIPIEIEEYKTELVSQTRKSETTDTYYFDFDSDGNSEKIEFLKNPITGIMVSSEDGLLDQWNFDPTFQGNPSINEGMAFFDVDNDGISEIILTTFTNGEILMHCFNPINDEIIFRDKRIAEYRMVYNEVSTSVKFIDAYDYNQDGFNEIYYSLETGYAVHPRGIYAYDFNNDTILDSPAGCNLYEDPKVRDIDQDGVPEFFGNSRAVGNCTIDDPFTDLHSWFMVFTSDMQWKFNPVKTGIYPSFFQVDQLDLKGEKLFVGLQLYQGIEDFPSYFALFDREGKMIRKREFEYSADWHEAILMPQISPDLISVFKKEGTLIHCGPDLDPVDKLEIPPVMDHHVSLDIDQDGKTEFLYLSEHVDQIFIVQYDYSGFTEIDLPEKVPDPRYSLKLSQRSPPELFVNGSEYNYSFHYFANPLYPFRLLLFPGYFLVVLGFISGLYKLQKIRLSQKYEAEKQLIELQLKSIKSQLDPHFTLNLLASIKDLFHKKDVKTTSYVFSKYTTLLRHLILNADQFTVSLPSELDFVRDYLTLEKFRFDDKLEFEINQDGIDERIKIPKMLVHSFVENAVKHGIRPRGRGKIEISCELKGKNCITTVRDNGVGRNSKETAQLSTGKGLSITDRIIENYGYLKNSKIHYRINDLTDEKGEALGTEVVIHIPV